MKIIGYTSRETIPESSPFIDEIVRDVDYKSIDCDYAIDITLGFLLEDPRTWLNDAGAYYGDYIDQHGTYCLHSMFPSIRTSYPGILYKASLLVDCDIKNPIEQICKNNIISYIPRPMFKIVV